MAMSASAELAISVFGRLQSESMGAQMGYMTEEFNRLFGITILQFPVRRAHGTQRLQFATGAFGDACLLALTLSTQELVPAFAEAFLAPVVLLSVGDDADAHVAVRVDRTGVVSTAAYIH